MIPGASLLPTLARLNLPIELVRLNVQDRTEDRAQYIHASAVVRTVLVTAVVSILVSTLESLLEVVLILAAVDV